MSIYALKPEFQALLRPLTTALARNGVAANQATLAAAVVSVILGLFIAGAPASAGALWGHMIEGHGGMLDRLDSVVFAAPIFFHATRYWWV